MSGKPFNRRTANSSPSASRKKLHETRNRRDETKQECRQEGHSHLLHVWWKGPACQALPGTGVAIAGINLNCTEERESLCHWISEKCVEFREMQIVRHAKFIGTMIGPDGHIHRWTAPRNKFIRRVLKINASTKSLVERSVRFLH